MPKPPTRVASHLAPVDGLRVLATASLVAFHATLIASGLLSAQGEAWTAFCTHPLAGLLQSGAFSVDVFLLLSGLLLALKLVDVKRGDNLSLSLGGVGMGAVKRACRLGARVAKNRYERDVERRGGLPGRVSRRAPHCLLIVYQCTRAHLPHPPPWPHTAS